MQTDRKVIILALLIIILLVGAVAVLYKPGSSENMVVNTTNQQQDLKQNLTTNASKNETSSPNVVAVQEGPAAAHKGENITLRYTVTNKGSQAVNEVNASAQQFPNENLGTINPGETKEFQHTLHIPTDEEVQENFGTNATVSNPFFIGSFRVLFKDAKGSEHRINSNSLEIKLV